MEKPVLLISRCLLGENVRYDGVPKPQSPGLEALRQHYTLLPVCPEVEFGMATPRPPIILMEYPNGTIRLVRKSDRVELTTPFVEFCCKRLLIPAPFGAILKSKSPSCGVASTKTYDPAGNLLHEHGTGFFAATIMELFPDILIADEHNFELVFHPLPHPAKKEAPMRGL